MMTKQIVTAALGLSLGLLGTACSESHSDRHAGNYPGDYRVEPGSRGDRPGYVVARGTGRINFRAERDGEVTVVNAKRNSEVLTRRVQTGDVLEVIPGRDEVLLNGRKIYDHNLEGEEPYAILYRPSASAGRYEPDYNGPRQSGYRYDRDDYRYGDQR